MINAVYTPDNDFLAPSGLDCQVPDDYEDTEQGITDEYQGFADISDELEEPARDTANFTGCRKPEPRDTANFADCVKPEPRDTDNFSACVKSEPTIQEDLVYEREESSRQVNDNLSYEGSPVQMQFGEEDGLQFPCIYIKSTQEGLEKHKLMALQNIVKAENAATRMPTYLDVNGSVIKLGTVDSKSLKTLLSNKLFSSWGITVKADAETEYDDDMRLAYCSI